MPPKAKKGGASKAAATPKASAKPAAASKTKVVSAKPVVEEPSDDDDDDDDFGSMDTDDEEGDFVILTPSDEEDEDDEDDEEGAESDDDEEDYDSEESDDVTEAGMERLMKALGDDGLDEDALAALATLRGEAVDEEEGSDDSEEEDEEDDEEDEDNEDEDGDDEEAETSAAVPSTSKDTLAASLLRSGLVAEEEEDEDDDEDEEEDPEADESAIAVDSLTDEAFQALPDAVRSKRFHRELINNKEALTAVRDAIALDPPNAKGKAKMEWIEHMSVTWDKSVAGELEEQGADAEDDLKRELAIYKQALHGAVLGRQRILTAGLPFSRPDDFFAEMVKSDSHMERIRQKLLDERSAIKASEDAKRQRELKKFGKKVQVEKQLERQKNKRDMEEKIQGLKRKRGTLDTGAEADDAFDVKIESALSGSRDRDNDNAKRGRGGDRDKARMPRSARDSKYGFGGKKKYSKSNTKESTEAGFGQYKGPPKKGGPGGGGGKGKKGGAAKRPGKSKRAGGGRR